MQITWAMKKGPWLFRGFVGDEKLPSYVGIIISWTIRRISIYQPGFNGKYRAVF